jgi:hypothetical protein
MATRGGARHHRGMLRHFAFLTVALSACNPSNTQDACGDIAHAYCSRIFDLSNQGCASATQFLASKNYTSLNDCTSDFRWYDGQVCGSISTNACVPDDFSGNRASGCASFMGNLQCGYDWTQGALVADAECSNICCVHQGNLGSGMQCCSGKSHVEFTGGCGSSTQQSVCD